MIHYDVVVVGAGSGNMIPDTGLDGKRVAIIERDRFGGTCLNRGCIPSKMLVHAAEVAETVRGAARFGIHADLACVDWPSIRRRVFGRTDMHSEETIADRRRSAIEVYRGEAHFVGPHVLEVDAQQIRGDQIVLAAGSRPSVPPIDGLNSVAFHTSDTIMRINSLPASMVIIGGGAVAAEMAHIFGAFGTHVTIVTQESSLLSTLDHDVTRRFTELASLRFDVRLDAEVAHVEGTPNGGVGVHLEDDARAIEADAILIATGRIPNSDVLAVDAGGIAVDEEGFVVTDERGATNVDGVWAIGDLVNHQQLKHLANAQMRRVLHNIAHPDDPRGAKLEVVPSAVFADPQIASVGPTERALHDQGRPFFVACRDYSDAAYGWALEDTTSFVKVMADPVTRRLLACHIIGPQAATLIQPLVLAMSLDLTIDRLAQDVLTIHPALTEVVAQAVSELSHRECGSPA